MVTEELKRFILRRSQIIDELLDSWMNEIGRRQLCGFGRDIIFHIIAEEIAQELDNAEEGEELGFWSMYTWKLAEAIEWYIKTYLSDMILDWYDYICD
jgi:hypothetical protein